MGKKKLTPVAPKKRRRGRPRKNRIKLVDANPKHKYISNEDRMKIALAAKAGHTPTDIANAFGCGWKAAVMISLEKV